MTDNKRIEKRQELLMNLCKEIRALITKFSAENYEQFSFDREKLGDKVQFLKDGCQVTLISFDDQPIGIELPVKVELKVTSAPEGARGDTAQGKVTKTATVETGASFSVPLFVKTGDTIRINTETGEYVERV